IDQNNISCFIPLNIPLEIDSVLEGQKDEVFTQAELEFLKMYQVFPNEENKIEGVKVFGVYLGLILTKQEFIKQKTQEKILQGIMSKFVISLFATDKIKLRLIEYSDIEKSEFGYQYIEYWKDFYSIETGMRDTDFNSNETKFL